MLFRLTEGSLFEDNPVITTMKEFAGITEQQMKFVIMYADWLSPYRNLGEEERRSRALDYAGIDSADGLKKFVSKYYDIQGIATERKSIDAIDKGLEAIRNKLADAESLDAGEIQKLTKALVELSSQRRFVMKQINELMGLEEIQIGEDESSPPFRYKGH